MKVLVNTKVNGTPVQEAVTPRSSLADFLRDDLGLTGTHLGCEMGACGACLVLLDGAPVHACLVLAVQAEGGTVETVEGLTETGAVADLQENFHDRNALQCGYCTSGMLMSAQALLARNAAPSRDEIRDALSGNYCRCTGYEAIVDAIAATGRARAAATESAQAASANTEAAE
ncbi:(2Fe-2S)-binding protein [Primorskyibacter flagellatus]|uniref:Carbon-monoxide dehydrogenase small subunit n=1 Tax=Primorskyibacter flagellatus TaxID=1387277 RepID=A0A1W2BVQ0_9RHOB|nr:(2Fe-2S)-binding protein [Primorskyibacter flagellatus]SMC76961.1 carbon-monoxide dehydrogenase small subunit [Primorskyibacter flagellatus]